MLMLLFMSVAVNCLIIPSGQLKFGGSAADPRIGKSLKCLKL